MRLRFATPLFLLLAITALVLQQGSEAAGGTGDCPNVGNDKGGARYSTLNQINRGSVRNLRVAWTYRTGDSDPARNTTIECTPLVIDGVMYVTTVKSRVAALNAATGEELWRFDPYAIPTKSIIASGGVNRGLAFWSDGKQKRILHGVGDGRLISINVENGKPDPAFGRAGEVDLREGMEDDLSKFPYGPTSAPMVFEDLVYLGFSASEGYGPGAPGDIRAFDVRTGKQRWRFRTVPRPGDFGAATWPPNSWQGRSGVNAWGGFTLDPKRGILYAGLGSAAFDFYGGDRKGNNLFANSTIALNARTGERIWHFQTTRHDLSDHDLPCPPVLATIKRDGKNVDVAAQVTKTGLCYVFDRTNGRPVFPIEERPAPKSDIPGEWTAPTQPIPVKPPPLSKLGFSESDLSDITPESNAYLKQQFRNLRGGPHYTPPSFEGTIVTPGFHGGANWSGACVDPTTGILYVNSQNVPWITKLVKNAQGSAHPYNFAGYGRFTDKEGYPGIKPPWGLLNAVDLNEGRFAWQKVLGEFPALTAKGIPQTGTENFGGPIVTAGGLVFIGGTMDEKFRAFDKSTGTVLWETKLPVGGYATPCTYAVNGKQYVVIAAGGGGKLATKPGDYFIAFALPDQSQIQNPKSKIELIAGGGTGEDGSRAVEARIIRPFAVDFNPKGDLVFVEFTGGERVRTIRNGRVHTIAGTGKTGYSGDGGDARQAEFSGMHSLVVARSGDIFVADTLNHRIRRIDSKTGIVTTFAGTGVRGFSGERGPAESAQLNEPYCLWMDSARNRLIVADLSNRRVRAIDLKNGIITTVAGNGQRGIPADGAVATEAPLIDPRAVTVDSTGNLYILERSGHCLRVVNSEGRIRTVAGTGKPGYSGDGGDAKLAQLNGPKHLWIDRGDSLLIADTENHVIRRYLPREGRIVHVAGTGKSGTNGIGGPPDQVELNQPHGIYAHRSGDLYISDSTNDRILRITSRRR